MLDELNLRRLTEMGIDAYVPRTVTRPAGITSSARAAETMTASAAPRSDRASPRVVLLARADDARAKALLAQVSRAFAFARIECTTTHRADESSLAEARGIIVFGEALAREAGSVLTTERQRTLGWVAGADAAAIAGDARAKRALWSELRRLVREFR